MESDDGVRIPNPFSGSVKKSLVTPSKPLQVKSLEARLVSESLPSVRCFILQQFLLPYESLFVMI